MNFLRLLLLASIIVQPAAVPASAAFTAGSCSESGAGLPGDACAVDIQSNYPLTAVSAIIAAASPLAPTFADASATTAENAVNDNAVIALTVQNPSGAQTSPRGTLCICGAQGTVVSCRNAIRPPGLSLFLFPPGGGFHASLLSFLATICVPAFPAQVTTNLLAYNHPAPRVGFFIAEGTHV